MTETSYSALIRTFNSERTLPLTLECLANQTVPPKQYVFVDSGSTDGTLKLAPKNSVVHRFAGREFNYSDAINQGLPHISSPYVFIVSSHAIFISRRAMEYALSLLAKDPHLGAAYFDHECDGGPPAHHVIDKTNFNGRNGLWNWCALVRMDLLKLRQFRPEVFSAEDQEWASWLFAEQGKGVARISNAGAINYNPKAQSLRKFRNEEVAIAYYIKPDLLKWGNIFKVLKSVLRPKGGLQPKRRLSQLILAFRLIGCRFSEPLAKSRYF